MAIKVGIAGYGNLGRGVEKAVSFAPDMHLKGVFTRRNPEDVKTETGVPVYAMDDLDSMKDKIDVLILCGGSATDLPVQTPALAGSFNVVDSFDTHKNIPDHFEKVDQAAKKAGKTGVISVGWDPGLFSLLRLIDESVLPEGETYTFWGKGVSQGHSDAVRRVKGVKDAKQYTLPVQEAINKVRAGEQPELSTREKHTRECFVVPEEGADLERIEKEIKEMPNYFDEYDTTVHFISKEELDRDHKGLPHGGFVLRSGNTGDNHHLIEYKLELDSNPEFTASVLTAAARACARMNGEGMTGAKTIFDIPPAYYSVKSGEALRKELL